jgi:hypothetical protein
MSQAVVLMQRFSNCGARPFRGALGPLRGGGVIYLRYIFIWITYGHKIKYIFW